MNNKLNDINNTFYSLVQVWSRAILISIITILSIPTIASAQYSAISFDGYDRTYLVHLPAGYVGEKNLPLVIAMHGGFGNAYGVETLSQLSTTADVENFIVVYPEGVQGGMFNIRTWNAGGCCGFASNNNIDDVGFIDLLLSTLVEQYAIDTNRVYATGFSNGALMAYKLACELSTQITAIAPVASSMSTANCTPERPVPVIHFHSYLDSNIPYLGGVGAGPSNFDHPSQEDIINLWENINNCVITETVVDNAEYTFTQKTGCDNNAEIHHYLTRDGGHSWPGGSQTELGDQVSTYINANNLMWSFFQQYTLQLIPAEVIFTNGFE